MMMHTCANDFEASALQFALTAHEGQTRKYTGESYIVHPIAVAELVRAVPHTSEMIAAAYLHDIVEDTPVTLAEIGERFGAEVRELVDWLTDREEGKNRAERKAKSLARWALAPAEAQTIKTADCFDNGKTIFRYDPHFSVVFAREVDALLGVLGCAEPALFAQAQGQIEAYYRDRESKR